jgi:hypothetical protein
VDPAAWLMLFVWCFAWAFTCLFVAENRNLTNSETWFLLGALFGLFALIVLLTKPAGPPRKPVTNPQVRCRQCGHVGDYGFKAKKIIDVARICRNCGSEDLVLAAPVS